jgi:hypothetical protein
MQFRGATAAKKQFPLNYESNSLGDDAEHRHFLFQGKI